MQIKGLHANIYKLSSYTLSQEKCEGYRKKYESHVKKWKTLKKEGVCDKTCAETLEFSRASYYRYRSKIEKLKKGILPPSKRPKTFRKPLWKEQDIALILKLRLENPTYGKAKIAIIMRRDHESTLSESTVGRILTYLKAKGKITKSRSAVRVKRKRNFLKGHAKPWTFKDYKTIQIGERVQIDHMTVSKNGITVKHFQAWDRPSKFIHANTYSHAKSSSAKRFLFELIKAAPFTITSVQVDGGSEFMAEFEQACQDLGIELIVLPPAKPSYNGGVERGNRTFKEEFYAKSDLTADSIQAMGYELHKAVHKYNTYRPHSALDGLTPMQYICSIHTLGPNRLSHII